MNFNEISNEKVNSEGEVIEKLDNLALKIKADEKIKELENKSKEVIKTMDNFANRIPVMIERLEVINKGIKAEPLSRLILEMNENSKILFDIGMCGWIGFMGSFNGRFYDGGYSGHDVNGRDYISENIRNTLNTARLVSDVEFMCGDYGDIDIVPGDVVYVDPPYKGTKQYAYSRNFDYERLYSWMRDLKRKGAKVFMSEYEAPDDFRVVWENDMKTCLNPTKTKIVKEKLFEIL